MKTSALAAGILFASSLYACEHPAEEPVAPVAPTAATPTPTQSVAAPLPAPSDSVATPPARGKRSPCTTDQSCNRDPSVSALWGHCVTDRGVCECNAGFELNPGGSCQPIAK